MGWPAPGARAGTDWGSCVGQGRSVSLPAAPCARRRLPACSYWSDQGRSYAELLDDGACSLGLAAATQVGQQRDEIAAAVAGGKVGPATGRDVDLEAAGVAVGPAWVQSQPLVANHAPTRQ